MVELAAAALELGSGVEHLAEDVLDDTDVPADGERAAEPVLDVGRCREVVRVEVGLENPLDLQPLLTDEGDELVRRFRRRAASGGVVIQYGVDNRTVSRREIPNDMAGRVGWLVKERRHLRPFCQFAESAGNHIECPQDGLTMVLTINPICRSSYECKSFLI